MRGERWDTDCFWPVSSGDKDQIGQEFSGTCFRVDATHLRAHDEGVFQETKRDYLNPSCGNLHLNSLAGGRCLTLTSGLWTGCQLNWSVTFNLYNWLTTVFWPVEPDISPEICVILQSILRKYVSYRYSNQYFEVLSYHNDRGDALVRALLCSVITR